MSLMDRSPELGPPWISRWRTEVSAEGYSLSGYDKLRCIFVRIPKTASRSVTLSLFGNLGGGHTDIRRYRKVFGDEFDRYFKFTFVRNPWDRLVSAYFFLKDGGLTPAASSWSQTHLSAFASFSSFVDGWVTPENVTTWRNFRPQHAYVCDADGHFAVDYVGCFERLEGDFRAVSQRLGIEAELLHENRTAGRRIDFRTYYTDAMAEAVGKAYARDIELFGYRFDHAPPGSPGLGEFT
jgi:hypothetical protein